MFKRDEWLFKEFKLRKDNDSSYSLRSFSRDLEISPATLSNVFNAKSSLSFKSVKEILENLNYETNKMMFILNEYKAHEERLKFKKKKLLSLINNLYDPLPEVKYIDLQTAKKFNFWEAYYLFAKMAHIPSHLKDVESKKKWLYTNTVISKELIDRIIGLYVESNLVDENLVPLCKSFDFHASTEEFNDLEFRYGFFETHYKFQDNLINTPTDKYIYAKWQIANLSLESSYTLTTLSKDFYARLSELGMQEATGTRKTYGFYHCVRTVRRLNDD